MLKCYGCKKSFRETELVAYAAPTAYQAHNYCPKCLKEKQDRDMFNAEVCKIFGLSMPGPRIWTERKRLMNKYGYTDQILIDCLKYLYQEQHLKILSESLCLINPTNVEKMLQWKRMKEQQNNILIQAMDMKTEEHVVTVKEEEGNNKKMKQINPDDWLDV